MSVYILILLMSTGISNKTTVTSQQIEYKSKETCDETAKQAIKRSTVHDAFCVKQEK